MTTVRRFRRDKRVISAIALRRVRPAIKLRMRVKCVRMVIPEGGVIRVIKVRGSRFARGPQFVRGVRRDRGGEVVRRVERA